MEATSAAMVSHQAMHRRLFALVTLIAIAATGWIAGIPPSSAQLADEAPVVISWEETAVPLRAFHYDRRSLICPPTDDPTRYPVWGDEFYTDNSSICSAAVHFGVITAEGGPVTIQEVDGLENYPSVERNGIVSESYGYWFFSFQFVGTFETVAPE